MTDRLSQLLQTVLENPADDGPRLVMADWCEEHGQGERAEYIRVGCELANRPSIHQVHALEFRAAELLDRHEAEWVRRELGMDLLIRNADGSAHYLDSRGWDQTKHPVKFHWDGGFIWQVECTLTTWRGRTCERCDGNGKRMGLGDEPPRAKCHVCHGIGRVGGIGPQLVRRAPIESVVVTDKNSIGGLSFWWEEEHDPITGHDIPDSVFFRLTGFVGTSMRGSYAGLQRMQKFYPSADAANAALSTALLQEARETPLTDVKEKVYS